LTKVNHQALKTRLKAGFFCAYGGAEYGRGWSGSDSRMSPGVEFWCIDGCLKDLRILRNLWHFAPPEKPQLFEKYGIMATPRVPDGPGIEYQ